MQALDIVTSTAEAAFATDWKGNIVAWNKAAERLLGPTARQVVGKRCYDSLRGTDPVGNRFCDAICPLVNMARRREAVHDFKLNLRNAKSEIVRADVSVVFVREPSPSQLTIVHTLKAREPEREADEHRAATPAGPARSNPLSRREIDVLRLLADGKSTGEIAELLYISIDTVRSHIKHILRKLKAHSRLEAQFLAKRDGLI
ncbi:MAG: PAS domain-containing protein [Deltaproteobacteria bacterium]|nr:PAS domain-containing protein [Deltaproteobacteria bacterium]